MIFYDTETCGLHGPIVLIQYAEDSGPIHLYSPWRRPVQETLELIEEFMMHEGGVCGFNLSFDHFHLCQLYTTLSLLKDKNKLPVDCVEEYYLAEPIARDGLCLKPQHAFDIMLYARKGPYQSTMDREDIRIKRVPTVLAWQLATELNRRIPIKDIYFARKQDRTIRWQVFDIVDDLGNLLPGMKDLVLKFAPSSALKALAIDAGVAKDDRLLYSDIALPRAAYPAELGYAPFALALKDSEEWPLTWPFRINQHVDYWSYNRLAREYAFDDVADTRGLYDFFGRPEIDDDDSILACAVGAVRWKGFAIDIPALVELRRKATEKEAKVRGKFNYNSVAVVRKYLEEVLGDAEKSVLSVDGKITTKGIILEEIAKWRESIVCTKCVGMGCASCDEGLVSGPNPHPAAERAAEIIKARKAKKEIEVYDKLILAGRIHMDFIVVGTRSGRMAGHSGLSSQGIKKSVNVRSAFPLASGGSILCGGDFSGFEIALADSAYGDPLLREDLMSGKKIHALFGTFLFPDKTYDQIIASDGASNFFEDFYGRSKNGVFALLYGGEAYTLSNRVGIPEVVAEDAYRRWCARYTKWGEERKKIFNRFCVSGETWTLTTEGPRQVKDLTHKCILIVDGQKYASEGFYKSGYKDVYEIVTEEGYRLQATEDHLLFMNSFKIKNKSQEDSGISSWIPVKKLTLGDKLHINIHKNIEWPGEGNWNDGYLLGWLYGDGTVGKIRNDDTRLYFCKNDRMMINFVIKLLDEKEFTCNYRLESDQYVLGSSYLLTLKEIFNIDYQKIITPEIESASSDFYKGFISAFFDTDGSANQNKKILTLSQSDLPRLQAIQRMLLRLGVVSRVYRCTNRGNRLIKNKLCRSKDPYVLMVMAENVIKFQERIGFKNPEKNERVLEAIEKNKLGKFRKEYFLVTVKSVNLIGKKTVYDVTVPEKDAFDANGFIAHNCSMTQKGGIGTRVEWAEPDEYIESLLGFKRYFTVENQIVKALYNLANDPPKDWLRMNIKVTRRDREQSAGGALRSALFAAAFAQQSANMRAAANHVIQSTGAQITKHLQRRIWDIQPAGIHPFIVQPMNQHDEVMCPTHPNYILKVKEVVDKTVESFREKVPLIKMDWKSNLKNWADKK